ncbi:MAG TPA: ATP-binding cassette domain-containing protein, partial [Blastocatellia bacterium]|nr:ATP-binding cassette domain-containing protein [Blastocatellia bacterium]
MQGLAIQTANLTRRYGSLTAVDGLSLEVPRGSIYGFLGPNGAGKTTTIRMLLGLINPDAGEVILLGLPLRRNRIALLSRVGTLVETPSIYPNLTGRENMEVTRRLRAVARSRVDRVLQIVRLDKDAGRKAIEYSLGMRQRLALALALLGDPELLILDEPTNGLDPSGIHEMRELIRRLPSEHNATIFLSSHLLSEVEQVATHIGIVNKGALSFQGPL